MSDNDNIEAMVGKEGEDRQSIKRKKQLRQEGEGQSTLEKGKIVFET
jgi:hypothetical protein